MLASDDLCQWTPDFFCQQPCHRVGTAQGFEAAQAEPGAFVLVVNCTDTGLRRQPLQVVQGRWRVALPRRNRLARCRQCSIVQDRILSVGPTRIARSLLVRYKRNGASVFVIEFQHHGFPFGISGVESRRTLSSSREPA